MSSANDLPAQYVLRFSELQDYRETVWKVLTRDFFSRYAPPESHVLDLGCGWGEFVNNIQAAKKIGMDLNPDCAKRLNSDVRFVRQDCSAPWQVPADSLDVVFTSNFFEHLPSKEHLDRTLDQALHCLKPGGKIIALGPNMRYLGGQYWDFYDHYVPLTDRSLSECLRLRGFEVETAIDRFLPYTMVGKRQAPTALVKIYLSFPLLWKVFGKQFLIVARKPVAQKQILSRRLAA